jgi:hypothetical protein
MFWSGLILGLIVGGNLGLMVAVLIAAARRDDPQRVLENPAVDVAVMEEAPDADWRTPIKRNAGYAIGEADPTAARMGC